jgi:hypothetical protein
MLDGVVKHVVLGGVVQHVLFSMLGCVVLCMCEPSRSVNSCTSAASSRIETRVGPGNA